MRIYEMTFVEAHQLADELIIVATFKEHLTVDDVRQSQQAIAPILAVTGRQIALIIDASEATIDFGETFNILRAESSRSAPDNLSGLKQLFVSTDAFVKLSVDAARQKQFGGMHFPLFQKLDDAIDAARQMMKQPD
jgi:hypothetical protein